MVRVVPIQVGRHTAVGVEVQLPKTTLLAVTAGNGYIMCGALDVALLNDRLRERGVIAGRAVGVRTLEELLAAPLESVTDAARAIGVEPGMTGRDAIARLAEAAGS
jgi:uncharacterized protein YunC (DUF1805 family)